MNKKVTDERAMKNNNQLVLDIVRDFYERGNERRSFKMVGTKWKSWGIEYDGAVIPEHLVFNGSPPIRDDKPVVGKVYLRPGFTAFGYDHNSRVKLTIEVYTKELS